MMTVGDIDRLIVNSPYQEPQRYWRYNRDVRTFTLVEGERRPAGYVVATNASQAFDDPGLFVEIPLVNQIRSRVRDWRASGWPGVSGITKRLLAYWSDSREFENRRFFFCQLEAIETLIWLTESSPASTTGIDIPSDGGGFERLCAKMATGSGKTLVMAMAIAWNVLNKVAYPNDTRFSKNVLVIAPGLTVRNRLSVLDPFSEDNYYELFRIVPSSMLSDLRKGKILVRNWHALNWATDEQIRKKRSVDKRGAKSDEAYVRSVLGPMASARNLLVINDEAHHAWRVPTGKRLPGVTQEQLEEATKWVGGLDRIHAARGIRVCLDFSATPFAPTGNRSTGEALFDWIVSDFSLNDAIESGLVKTPRVVIRDDAVPDASSYRSRLYHIYNDDEVKDDLNRKAAKEEPLPDLVVNGYFLLGYDWRETARRWKEVGAATPPVLITVANRTETAARIKFSFDRGKIGIDELCDPSATLHIDSKVLKEAEAADEPLIGNSDDHGMSEDLPSLNKTQKAELLRQRVDTVGQVGKPGENIQNVISVGMLSEGWDAKTVTHIMGLRAFSSQLLCEQVVGRGLRRTAYEVDPNTGLFEPEYVNIFGVPFTFLPHESHRDSVPPPPQPKTAIEPDSRKSKYELTWPNVVRIDYKYRNNLSLDVDRLDALVLDASRSAQIASLAPIIDGKPDIHQITRIDLEKLGRDHRQQRVAFLTARDLFDQMKHNWTGNREELLVQLIRLVDKFLNSEKFDIIPRQYATDPLKKRVVVALNMTSIMQHIWNEIRVDNSESIEIVLDEAKPIMKTADAVRWFTSRPCEYTDKSHINFCTFDSSWESSAAFQFDSDDSVQAWVKNDHIGFEIFYLYRGVVHKYRPDFIVRLTNGICFLIETKGV